MIRLWKREPLGGLPIIPRTKKNNREYGRELREGNKVHIFIKVLKITNARNK